MGWRSQSRQRRAYHQSGTLCISSMQRIGYHQHEVLYIIKPKALIKTRRQGLVASISPSQCNLKAKFMFENERNLNAWGFYYPPRGTARGKKDHQVFRGSGRGVGEWKSSKKLLQRHPVINKIAHWAIWHIFLAVFDSPHFASETEKFAVSAYLRSARYVARGWRW